MNRPLSQVRAEGKIKIHECKSCGEGHEIERLTKLELNGEIQWIYYCPVTGHKVLVLRSRV